MPQPTVSFEFFPPRSVQGSFNLWDCAQTLAAFEPEFVSVTYGAGGTTRKITQEAVMALHDTAGFNVAAHLTCVGASRQETLEVARGYLAAGITDIVALRGDPPKGSDGFIPHPDGFASSVELIAALKDLGADQIRVGAYPERHPEAASRQADIDYLKAKIDAGATGAITQFSFEAETFFRFRDACAAAGIAAPILPGILPIENWAGTQKFAQSCGADVPMVLRDGFEKAQQTGTHELLATAVATELCDDLINEGVEHLHFYTLNKAKLTRDVCTALGLSRGLPLQKVA